MIVPDLTPTKEFHQDLELLNSNFNIKLVKSSESSPSLSDHYHVQSHINCEGNRQYGVHHAANGAGKRFNDDEFHDSFQGHFFFHSELSSKSRKETHMETHGFNNQSLSCVKPSFTSPENESLLQLTYSPEIDFVTPEIDSMMYDSDSPPDDENFHDLGSPEIYDEADLPFDQSNSPIEMGTITNNSNFNTNIKLDFNNSNLDLNNSNLDLNNSNLDLNNSNLDLNNSNLDLNNSNLDLNNSNFDFNNSNLDLNNSNLNTNINLNTNLNWNGNMYNMPYLHQAYFLSQLRFSTRTNHKTRKKTSSNFPEIMLHPWFQGLPQILSNNLAKPRKPKEIVDLQEETKKFKKQFYLCITTNKRAPKCLICALHDAICQEAHLNRVQRSEYRSIDRYFKNYAQYQDIIIPLVKEEFQHNQEKYMNLIRVTK
ncbi:hypothetical protein TRFO_38797 [Tritrichomonas foetus]|uniref:Uncharacterized protein n=1 Tax=Tritrichomonas foetus TaxID=1144522 RepID=A0A1J4J6X5_9EUKA|nr:hypothetical protein TRFO_38797 [Tritrichomonas foetus]|eukprot:OHS94986.1 hypothetical protein TRFO_38797 [Tritrichomonas foetus]